MIDLSTEPVTQPCCVLQEAGNMSSTHEQQSSFHVLGVAHASDININIQPMRNTSARTKHVNMPPNIQQKVQKQQQVPWVEDRAPRTALDFNPKPLRTESSATAQEIGIQHQ